jgi:hypothetical protein
MIDILSETLSDLKDWRTWLQLFAAIVFFLGINVCGYAAYIVSRGW